MASAIRTSGCIIVSSFLFHSQILLNKKIRKVAQPQSAKRTSSPCRYCSRATFRQSHKETHTIVDRSSLTSALISACPLAASDVGSSDRRINDLGATFLFCICIIPYSPLDLKNYSLVPTKVYILFIPGGLILLEPVQNKTH